MPSRSINRQEFLVLTLTVGTAAILGCSDDPAAPATPGTSGSGGTPPSTGGGGSGGAATGGGGSGGAATGGGGASTGGGGSGGAATGGGGSGGAATGGGGSGGAATGGGGSGGAGGSGGGGAGGGGGGGMCTGDIDVMSSGGHQHSLKVTMAQIMAGTEVTILSGMSMGHAHYVKVTAADFTALKAGMEVKKKSCAGGDHEYVLKCGGGGSAPMAPTCTDDCGDGNNMSGACP